MAVSLQTSPDVLLVTIYSKSEQSDVNADELLRIIRDEQCRHPEQNGEGG